MDITVNGEHKSLDGPLTTAGLLRALGYECGAVAVARNGEFVPRASYAAVVVRDGDEIECVAPRQGG